MIKKEKKIKWSKRLEKEKLKKLYLSDASGMLDGDLLNDVALTLYLRCLDIIAVRDARNGRVRCPECYSNSDKNNCINLPELPFAEREQYILVCADCGFSFTWQEFRYSYKGGQLNPGGAVPAFERYIKMYERKLGEKDLMLEVDRLIHEFHYYIKKDGRVITLSAAEEEDIDTSDPDPVRSVSPNLIEGKLSDIVVFLDSLTYNLSSPELKQNATEWKIKLEK